MSGRSAPPRVLAFADVRTSLVASARVHAPLRALREAGLVESYVVTDATLRGAPRDGRFDVVWLQRAADAWLARALASRLHGRYLLDLDDHLLCRPAYLEPADLPDPAALTAALEGCRVLTAPTPRLATLLQDRSGARLDARSFTCPNAVPPPWAPLRAPERPAAMLLTQGHRLALTASRGEVLTAISEGAARHRLPLWALGDAPGDLRTIAAGAGAALTTLRPRSWNGYHAALAGPPALLAVAPLETRGDPDTVEFVGGKSDVKMVEYGAFGHPAVYSAAAPYADSDLSCGRLAANDAASWTRAIDELMAGGWGVAADEAREVRERRDLARVAAECWWPALQAARLEEPVRGADLLGELDRVRARVRDHAARLRWRLRRGR
jgi:hypothetical protein